MMANGHVRVLYSTIIFLLFLFFFFKKQERLIIKRGKIVSNNKDYPIILSHATKYYTC